MGIVRFDLRGVKQDRVVDFVGSGPILRNCMVFGGDSPAVGVNKGNALIERFGFVLFGPLLLVFFMCGRYYRRGDKQKIAESLPRPPGR